MERQGVATTNQASILHNVQIEGSQNQSSVGGGVVCFSLAHPLRRVNCTSISNCNGVSGS